MKWTSSSFNFSLKLFIYHQILQYFIYKVIGNELLLELEKGPGSLGNKDIAGIFFFFLQNVL